MNTFTQKKRILCYLCFLSFIGLKAQSFTDITQLDGITIVHDGHDPALDFDYIDLGTGAAWLDFNNDGNLDLYVTMRAGANLLFENLGYDMTANDYIFDEVAVAKGVANAGGDGAGVSVTDFDNDGNMDIFLANTDGDKLFKNDGFPNYTFTDITATSGLTVTAESRGTSASWGDYDGDGYLDLYISHHGEFPGNVGGIHQDFLFHNNGNSTFTNVSSLLGIVNLSGYGFIGGWTDFDNDGDMDLILVNDCDLANPSPDANTHTRIFENNSDISSNWMTWNFTEVSASIGVDDCRNGMGIAVGDFNRDGWMDFFYTNIGDCVLFQNDGDGTFTDVSSSAGIDNQDMTHYSWGCAFLDHNLDGYQDIIVALGALNQTSGTFPRPNQLFENNGDSTFTNIAGSVNMADDTKSRSSIYGDYDNDGDLDVFFMSYGEQCILKRNEHINDMNTGNNWLQVKLTGDPAEGSNKDAVGSRLKLTYGATNEVQYFETRSGSNLGGGDDSRAYFGLGSETTISELKITWPSGNVQIVMPTPAINQILSVSELVPLPIQLTEFTAKPINRQVLLEWTTASEIQNAYFTIQRSADGSNFENIGRVAGNGNATVISNYDFLDEKPFTGSNYYRLGQTDYDGTETFSAIRNVRFESTDTAIKIIPNPVTKDGFQLSYSGSDDQVTFEVFDLFGKSLQSGFLQNKESKQINTSFLPNGLYLLRLSGEMVNHVEKVLISR
ncbi:MAG: hypothetical protein ACI8X3_000274 [Saprospiraceae bacterium]|jgi:hypothetical protein